MNILTRLLSTNVETGADEAIDVIKSLMNKISDLFKSLHTNAADNIMKIIQIILIVVACKVVLMIISSITKRVITKNQAKPTGERNNRIESLMSLFRSAARYMIYVAGFLLFLVVIGQNSILTNFLTTAGIGALAIGFGAQSLVKDVVLGLFMMFENQYSVGDFVEIDGVKGTVQATALRVTYLRNYKGDQIIIPNGTITKVTNFTRGTNMAEVSVAVSYDHDTRSVIHLIDQAVQHCADENLDKIADRPKVLGIQGFEESYVKIGIVCKVQAMSQWEMERQMRLAIKETFDSAGIHFPYPQRQVHQHDPNDYEMANQARARVREAAVYGQQSKPIYDQQPIWQTQQIDLDGDDYDSKK